MSKKTVQTITDLARLAGVSKSTISRALNNSPLIGDETRERIQALATEHNFQFNSSAQRLSKKESRTIGYVTHAHLKDFSWVDLFGMEIMGGVSRGLYQKGYDMLVIHITPGETGWVEQCYGTGRVDGFILLSAFRANEQIDALLKKEAPFIVWGVPRPNQSYCTVVGDNLAGGRLATEYLMRLGRQKIAFLGGLARTLDVQLRYAGYEAALQAAGRSLDPNLIVYGDYSAISGRKSMQVLLEQAPDLDAVFVNSDLMAIAAMEAIRDAGRRVPEEIAVVGYDNLTIAEFTYPSLTTISQNVPKAGQMLAQNLLQYLESGIVSNVTMPVELVIRKSA